MSEVYTQSDSTEGITGLTALRMLRLTQQGQHRTRGGVHDWYCLFRFVKFTIRLDENSVQTFSPRGHTHPFNCNRSCLPYKPNGGSVAEWLACWTQAQKGPGSNRSRDAVA